MLATWWPDLTYAEGVAEPSVGGWFAHAWCVTADGVVVEPTWSETGLRYFGVSLDDRTAARAVLEAGVFSSLLATEVVKATFS